MCGIAGFIGASLKPKTSYQLITKLFEFLEVRGTDAAGVWATEAGEEGRVVYHKEPIKSSQFVHASFWKKLSKLKLDCVLVHARAASKGPQHAIDNDNNHPFVSSDKRIGMVHNGNIEEAEFLRNKYEVLSDTDSEVLLRIYEDGLENTLNPTVLRIPYEVSKRVHAIRDIWSVVSNGAMAVALGERLEKNERFLFLFRNEKRPLWVIDLREPLGQIFFVSSPEIWYRTVTSTQPLVQELCCGSQKLIEVPVGEVWAFHLDENNPQMKSQKQFYRFELEVINKKPWKHSGEPIKVQESKLNLPVLTQLEQVPKKQVANANFEIYDDDPTEPFAFDYHEGGAAHINACERISTVARDIMTAATNCCLEGTMSPRDYEELLVSLEQSCIELEGTLRLIP